MSKEAKKTEAALIAENLVAAAPKGARVIVIAFAKDDVKIDLSEDVDHEDLAEAIGGLASWQAADYEALLEEAGKE